MSLKETVVELDECRKYIETLEKRGTRGSEAKTRADKKMNLADNLIKEIRSDIFSGINLLTGENKTLKDIKPLCKQGELFLTTPCYDKKLFQQCLDSLVETI